jgi:hypothetical protein
MFSNSSQVTGKFSNAKLSLDPKMEVSVGDGGYGIVTNKEDLTLSGIAMKEAWISNYPWVVTNDPNTVIGTLPVSCGYTQIQANTNLNTPAAFVGNLFKYWRGTVRYRIKVLANKFARGRIAIIYESRSDSTMPLTQTDVNEGIFRPYAHILDISDSHEIVIDIPWTQSWNFHQTKPSLMTGNNLDIAAPWSHDSLEICGNGYLKFVVVNSLAGVEAGASVYLQVSTCVCDAEFYAPKNPVVWRSTVSSSEQFTYFDYEDETVLESISAPLGLTRLETIPEEGDIVPMSEETFEAVASTAIDGDIGSSSCDNTNISSPLGARVYGGERINSVLALCKRFSTVSCSDTTRLSSGGRGTMLLGVDLPSTLFSAGPLTGPTYFTYMAYFAPAYLGFRGGIRYQMAIASERKDLDCIVLRDHPFNLPVILPSNLSNTTYTGTDWIDTYHTRNNMAGFYRQTLGNALGGVEFEVPFYWNRKFLYGRSLNTTAHAEMQNTHVFAYTGVKDNETIVASTVISAAAADDFSLGWFLSTPVMYFTPL